MQKLKVSEATTHQINWLVAYAQGRVTYPSDSIERGQYYHVDSAIAPHGHEHNRVHVDEFNPTTNWDQAGPIIDLLVSDGWRISKADFKLGVTLFRCDAKVQIHRGSTILIAAMRCFVASKLGDVVDVPDALVEAEPEQADEPEDSPPSPQERG